MGRIIKGYSREGARKRLLGKKSPATKDVNNKKNSVKLYNGGKKRLRWTGNVMVADVLKTYSTLQLLYPSGRITKKI